MLVIKMRGGEQSLFHKYSSGDIREPGGAI